MPCGYTLTRKARPPEGPELRCALRVYDFLRQNWNKLRFGPSVETGEKRDTKVNPKRARRDIKKQMKTHGVGSKSQQAFKLWQEERRAERKLQTRELREEERVLRFRQKRLKRKEKHKGR